MIITDIILLVFVCVVLLGLVWLSEKAKDWLWSYVFRFLGFLFKTTLGCLGLVLLVGTIVGLVSSLLSAPDPIVVAAAEAQGQVAASPGFPDWFRLGIYGAAGATFCILCVSAYRRLSPDNSEEEEPEEDPNAFPWKRCLLGTLGFSVPTTAVAMLLWLRHVVGSDPASGWSNWRYAVASGLFFLVAVLVGFCLWTIYELWRRGRQFRLEEAELLVEEQAAKERRLEQMANLAETAERLAQAEPLAEEARWRSPDPDDPEPTDPGVRFNPRNPASGGPTHSPALGSRPMPPPTFGRAPAREPEEHDMDDIHEPTPPRRPVGRGGRPFLVVGLVVLALAGVGYLAWSNHGPSDQQKLVTGSAQLQAEDTLRAVMKTDPVLSESCPQGWDNDCWRVLDAAKIELPPCVQVGQGQVNTTGASWWVAMDDSCRVETIRQNGRRVEAKAEAKAEEPWLDLEFYTDIQGYHQRKAFKAGDTAKINLLLEDPALKREVILDFWRQPEVPRRILAHPSLTKGDLDGIYAEVQANGWYDAMLWLIINPNLDANLRGKWLLAPQLETGEAGKIERERRVLLGLHQPNVPTGAVSLLVDQAVEEGQKGDLDLWKVLVKAAENGDLPAHRCRLSTDKAAERDAVKKQWPVCIKGQTWDFIAEMKGYAEQEGSPFASVVADWEALKYKCQWEGSAGRHSGPVKNRSSKMIPQLADVSPANLPPEP